MNLRKIISIIVLFSFLFTIIAPDLVYAQKKNSSDNEIESLLKKAEQEYLNGNFKKAILIYEKIINIINEKKEYVKTKEELIKTIISLALTYFTIKETDKAKQQFEKVIKINPNYELDKDFYSEKFISLFNEVKNLNTGKLVIKTTPDKADVYVNGVYKGKTPYDAGYMFKGLYEVKIVKKGFKLNIFKAEIKPGTAFIKEISLNPIKAKVVEVKKGKKKKKKKSILPYIIGGAAVVVLAIVLLTKKSSDETQTEEELKEVFSLPHPFNIEASKRSYGLLNVIGITGKITKVEYRVVVDHPKMEDLLITIINPENSTSVIIWKKVKPQNIPQTLEGSTLAFNSSKPNGEWKLMVDNTEGTEVGVITEWEMRIYYKKL